MVKKAFSRFAADESGAVTVDWVVLTAAIVGLGFATFAAMRPQTLVTAGTDMGATAASATETARAVMNAPQGTPEGIEAD